MWWGGRRKTLPESEYEELCFVMEITEWTWRECVDFYENAPLGLFDEWLIRKWKQKTTKPKK